MRITLIIPANCRLISRPVPLEERRRIRELLQKLRRGIPLLKISYPGPPKSIIVRRPVQTVDVPSRLCKTTFKSPRRKHTKIIYAHTRGGIFRTEPQVRTKRPKSGKE